MSIPQLRVRTEFSFRKVFGPIARVAAALREIEAPCAGIVDSDTWGHVRFERALKDGPVRPLFGTEIPIPKEDGTKPVAWALASDMQAFYRFSTAARRPDADIEELFASEAGIVRFAGAALTDPECFDYVDINPGSPLQQRRAIALAAHTGKPLVVTSDNAYPRPEDFSAFMAVIDRQRASPQHLLTRKELHAALVDNGPLNDVQFIHAVNNTFEASERCVSKLESAPMLSIAGDLWQWVMRGKAERLIAGQLIWNEEYEKRIAYEMRIIYEKKFDSYFIAVADLIRWAKQRMLVGPGRGSSAGSLVCYLLGITEIDPMPHGLLFERFIDFTRTDFPDIDIDFNHEKRDLIFGYLGETYGNDCVARIGNVSTLKPPSLLAKSCRKFGVPDHERYRLLDVIPAGELEGSSIFGKTIQWAMESTGVGQRFIEKYPATKSIAAGENHADHTSTHSGGVAVCTVPLSNFCTVGPDGVAHLDKVDAEQLNVLKIDALSIRTLAVIEGAGVASNQELYSLKPDDPEVLKLFNEGRFVGVFQFEGGATGKIASQIHIDNFRFIDHISALSRPGPLASGATDHYIKRVRGEEQVTYSHPALADILSKTQGIILFQEQVMRICKDIAGFSWPDVMEIRRAIGKKKGNEYFDRRRKQFVEGAQKTVGMAANDAEDLWRGMLTFGTYGFNQSHSVSYGYVSYWCAWMKTYHPLAFAASCLRLAKDDLQTAQILKEIQSREGIEYVAFDIDRSGVNWEVHDNQLVGGFTNLVGIGPVKAHKAVEDRNAGVMTPKQRERLLSLPVKFAELFPLKRDYRDWYLNPEEHGCIEGTKILTSNKFPNKGEVVWLGRVIGRRSRDENEARLVDRRGGIRKDGQTKFADILCLDDYATETITCRIPADFYEHTGRMALDNLKNDDVILVRGWKVPEYNIIRVKRIMCITRPEVLNPEFAGAVFNASGQAEILPPAKDRSGPEPQPAEVINE